jgi:hypothetical protein
MQMMGRFLDEERREALAERAPAAEREIAFTAGVGNLPEVVA